MKLQDRCCADDAGHVRLGSPHLHGLFRCHPLDSAHQPAVRAEVDPGARQGPHLPGTHLLRQGLRQERRALPRLRPHLHSLRRLRPDR